MTDAQRTAERLKVEREHIVSEWETRVRGSIPEVRKDPASALRDSVPHIVERIAEAVASGDASLLNKAQEHGKERAAAGKYTIEQVIREYHLLEEVLFRLLESGDTPPTPATRRALRAAIQACIIASAAEFDAVRTEELSRDRELYTHLVDGVRDYAIFSVDPNGFVTTWNQGATRMKGYAADEIIGRHFEMLYTEDARQRDEPMEHLEMASQRGRYRGEGWRLKKGGEHFLADVLITPMYLRGQLAGYSKVVADLTERSKIVQERELSRTLVLEAQAEQRSREEYVSRLSHDVRSPLQAARMSAELLRRRPDDPEVADRLMDRLVRNIVRVDEMIQQLLDTHRLRAGELPSIQLTPCSLDAVVRATVDELRTAYGDRFVLEAPGSIEGEWDPDAIRRIVENLCGNAVKYGSAAHPITVVLLRTSNEVQIAVHNHGEPIPPDERESLFDQFTRTPEAKATSRGWGIGLAVVKSLVEAHGGKVRVESVESEGTTFKIDLPLHPEERSAGDEPSPPASDE